MLRMIHIFFFLTNISFHFCFRKLILEKGTVESRFGKWNLRGSEGLRQLQNEFQGEMKKKEPWN